MSCFIGCCCRVSRRVPGGKLSHVRDDLLGDPSMGRVGISRDVHVEVGVTRLSADTSVAGLKTITAGQFQERGAGFHEDDVGQTGAMRTDQQGALGGRLDLIPQRQVLEVHDADTVSGELGLKFDFPVKTSCCPRT